MGGHLLRKATGFSLFGFARVGVLRKEKSVLGPDVTGQAFFNL